MSRVPCSRCEDKCLSDSLEVCRVCLAPFCHACVALHRAEAHFKEPERIVHSKSEETKKPKEEKKGKKHFWDKDDEHGSLADA